ncbi:MAG: hypothetical protein DMG15_06045 [Acidobacteria bacterium]|nr:MAG: hypothetical protein DMG15_06045 [Acidobacteriota bacterium]
MIRSSVVLLLVLLGNFSGFAQGRGGGERGAAPQAPRTPRAAAPFDMTGYWVSIVSEDWRWRMFPNKGDYAGVPLNPEGRKVADSWDPAKDEAAVEQCKAYGAPGIMGIPGRFHITWFISVLHRLQRRTCKAYPKQNGSSPGQVRVSRLPETAVERRQAHSK